MSALRGERNKTARSKMKSEVSTLRKDLLTTQSLHLLHSRYTYYTVATLTTQSLTYYVHFSY